MKKDDVIAGILGGTIFVIGCTVGIFGYKKLHEPMWKEMPAQTVEQTERYEYTDNISSYPKRDVMTDPVSVAESQDGDIDFVMQQEAPVSIQPPVEEGTGQVNSENTNIISNEPDLTVIDSSINVPTNDETQIISRDSNGYADNRSNFDKYDNEEQQNTSDQFVLNTSTMKIHYPTCNDVKKISPENYATSNNSIEELRSQGYTLCGHCFR